MPELRFALICTKAVVDKYTNNLSVFEVLDEVSIQLLEDLPQPLPRDRVAPIQCQIVSLWSRIEADTPELAWCRYSLVTPDGEEHRMGLHQEINLSTHKRSRLIAGIRGIQYRGDGVYFFKLFLAATEADEGTEIGTVSFDLKARSKPPDSQPPD